MNEYGHWKTNQLLLPTHKAFTYKITLIYDSVMYYYIGYKCIEKNHRWKTYTGSSEIVDYIVDCGAVVNYEIVKFFDTKKEAYVEETKAIRAYNSFGRKVNRMSLGQKTPLSTKSQLRNKPIPLGTKIPLGTLVRPVAILVYEHLKSKNINEISTPNLRQLVTNKLKCVDRDKREYTCGIVSRIISELTKYKNLSVNRESQIIYYNVK